LLKFQAPVSNPLHPVMYRWYLHLQQREIRPLQTKNKWFVL
jgi:hypothetical protein